MPYSPTHRYYLCAALQSPTVALGDSCSNRDGDCLSDLVLPMFGSIASAESLVLGFNEDLSVVMAEAPTGQLQPWKGRTRPIPAAILAAAALLKLSEGAQDVGQAVERAAWTASRKASAPGIRWYSRHQGVYFSGTDRLGRA